MKISLDLMARRVVMASMMYYGLDIEIMPDWQFDEYCNILADHWGQLSEERKLSLGSPEEIRTSGYHIKVSTAAQGGACSWMEQKGIYDPAQCRPFQLSTPKYLKGLGNYLLPHEFAWEALPRSSDNRVIPLEKPIRKEFPNANTSDPTS